MSKDKETLKKLVTKYTDILSLHGYHIDFMLSDNDHIISKMFKGAEQTKSDYEACVLNADYSGRAFSVVLNRSSMKGDIADTVCHELIHILLWGFADMVENLINTSGLSEEGKAKFIKEITKREHEVVYKLIKVIK